MPRKPKYSDKELAKMIKDKMGLLTKVAEHYGCTLRNIQDRIERSTMLQNAYVETVERDSDSAEFVVKKQIREQDADMAKWYLERKGRSRGYGKTDSLEIKNIDKYANFTDEELDDMIKKHEQK